MYPNKTKDQAENDGKKCLKITSRSKDEQSIEIAEQWTVHQLVRSTPRNSMAMEGQWRGKVSRPLPYPAICHG